METKIRDYQDNWKNIKNATMTTINKDEGIYPTSEWKRRLLMSEHSPIRKLKIGWKWYDLKYWVSVHITRHKIGIDHFVRTQRTDRTGQDRNEIPQGALVEHEVEANAQAIINTSRKRLCLCASPETTKAWKDALKEIEKYEPELVSVSKRECVYRNGLCPEMFPCGYNKTNAFKKELEEYLKGMEAQISPYSIRGVDNHE